MILLGHAPEAKRGKSVAFRALSADFPRAAALWAGMDRTEIFPTASISTRRVEVFSREIFLNKM